MAFESIRGATRALSSVVLPHSASPQRADLRPPTCRSVGLDLARSLNAVSQGDPNVSRHILEHTRASLPPAAWPVGQPSEEDLVGAKLLSSLKGYVEGALALPEKDGKGGGTRPKASQQALHTIAAAVYDEDITRDRKISSALRLTGLSRTMWHNGGELRASNNSADVGGGRGVTLGAERHTRCDATDLEWLYEYFHNDSPDVECDKSVKWNYKRKKIFCAGKERMIYCRPKVLTTTVAEAVQNAMKSDVYVRSGVQMHPANVAACICKCIKPAKREECACPTCTEFIEALSAYNKKRPGWHGEGAVCDGSCGLDCKNRASEFRTFTKNHSEFETHLRCPKSARPAAQLPHESDAPEFYQLRCCLKRRRNAAGEPTGEYEPRQVPPCSRCAPKRARLLQAPGESQCPDEHNDAPVTWRKYKDIELEPGKTTNKLVEHHGTRRELLTQIENTAQEWSFHRQGKAARSCAVSCLPVCRVAYLTSSLALRTSRC